MYIYIYIYTYIQRERERERERRRQMQNTCRGERYTHDMIDYIFRTPGPCRYSLSYSYGGTTILALTGLAKPSLRMIEIKYTRGIYRAG